MFILPDHSRSVESPHRVQPHSWAEPFSDADADPLTDDFQSLLSFVTSVMTLPWDGKRVTGVIRVSTSKQAEEGFSLEGQEDEIREFCKIKTIDLDRIHDAVGSGHHWGHVRRAIEHAKANKNAILIPGLDRFSRQQLDTILHECLRHRVRPIILDGGREVDPYEIASGEHGRRERSRNTKRGIKTKRKYIDRWGRRSLAEDARRYAIRTRILELDQEGLSPGLIEQRLRDEDWKKVPTRKTIRKMLNEVGKKGARLV